MMKEAEKKAAVMVEKNLARPTLNTDPIVSVKSESIEGIVTKAGNEGKIVGAHFILNKSRYEIVEFQGSRKQYPWTVRNCKSGRWFKFSDAEIAGLLIMKRIAAPDRIDQVLENMAKEKQEAAALKAEALKSAKAEKKAAKMKEEAARRKKASAKKKADPKTVATKAAAEVPAPTAE